MKSKITLFLSLFFFISNAQQNDFRIGMFGFNWTSGNSDPNNSCGINENILNNSGFPSSHLNVLNEDGFNAVVAYGFPDSWFPENSVESGLKLIQKFSLNNKPFMVVPSVKQCYKPNVPANPDYNNYMSSTPSGTIVAGGDGSNVNDYCLGKGHANYDHLFSLYTSTTYRNIIWGHHCAEEPEYCHAFNYTDQPEAWAEGRLESDCGKLFGTNSRNYNTVMPPTIMRGIMNYFENKSSGLTQKYILMDANHGQFINDFCGGSHAPTAVNSLWRSNYYMSQLNKWNTNEVFFEGSYCQFDPASWTTLNYNLASVNTGGNAFHYLSKFANIDYAKTKASSVHSVIGDFVVEWPGFSTVSYNGLIRHIHGDITTPNANWLWFQAYTSIIHGASGVWFWDINSFKPQEKENALISDGLYSSSDQQTYGTWSNYDNMNETQENTYANEINNRWNSNVKRFKRDHFPSIYRDYVSNLSKELRYLTESNLLSTDPNSVVYSKTINADANCILPNAQGANVGSYVYNAFVSKYGQTWVNNNPAIINEKCSEIYGLRYTIRTNGTDVIMIISNPLNIPVSNILLNFNSVTNPVIQNSVGVDVLFEHQPDPDNYPGSFYTNTGASGYKTGRNSSITLSPTLSLGQYYSLNYPNTSNKSISLNFGPLDVHILKFKKSSSFQAAGYNNGWDKEWSNNGNSTIGGWGLVDNDRLIPGNFYNELGDNASQELLCIQSQQSGTWSSLLKYNSNNNGNKTWDWIWSNDGSPSPSATGWNIASFDKYIAGDFINNNDGGVEELLCVQALASNAKSVLLKFNKSNYTWSTPWSNVSGSGVGSGALHVTFSGWSINTADKYLPFDYDGNGDMELLCINVANGGWWAILDYYNNDWQWVTGGGSNMNNLWTNDAASEYSTGNFDGAGNRNDLICMKRNGSISLSRVLTFTGGNWQNVWTNNSSNNIGGWSSPIGTYDLNLAGNIDGDTKDELMFIQNCTSCGWAQTTHLDASNKMVYGWGNHSAVYSQPGDDDFIDDWYLADASGSNSRYFLIKPLSNKWNFLFATRKYGCNKYLANMYSTNNSGVSDYKLIPSTSNLTAFTGVILFPNPNSGSFTLSAQVPEQTTISVQVFNHVGQKVKAVQESLNGGENLIPINLGDVSPGIYFVTYQVNSLSKTEKMVIMGQ